MARMWTHSSATLFDHPNLRESLTTFVTLLNWCCSYVDRSIAAHWLLQVQQLELDITAGGLSDFSATEEPIDRLFRSRRGFVVEQFRTHEQVGVIVGVEACLMRANIQEDPALKLKHPTAGLVERVVLSLVLPPKPNPAARLYFTVSGFGESPRSVLETTVGDDQRWSIHPTADVRFKAELLYGEQAIDLGLEAAPIYRNNQG